jgi:hypothetical protein
MCSHPHPLGIRSQYTDPDLYDFVNQTTTEYTDLPVRLSSGCCSDYQSFYEAGYPAMALFESAMTVMAVPRPPRPPPPQPSYTSYVVLLSSVCSFSVLSLVLSCLVCCVVLCL